MVLFQKSLKKKIIENLLLSPEDELVLISSLEGSASCDDVSWVANESTEVCFCCCWSLVVFESDVSPVKSLVFPEKEADFLWQSFSLPPSAFDLVLLSEDCGRLVVLLFRLCVLWWFWRMIFSPFSLIAKLLVLDPDRKSITPCSSSNEAMEGDWSFEPDVVGVIDR